MQLKLLPETFSILKLTPPQDFPTWLGQAGIFFIAQTKDEHSVICPQDTIPDGMDYNANYHLYGEGLRRKPHKQSLILKNKKSFSPLDIHK